MKTTNHTPTPWDIKPLNGFPLSIIGGDSENVADCSAHRLPGIALANARLISSAPDMFQALQAIVDAFGDQNSLLIDQCKAALAKAKGEA